MKLFGWKSAGRAPARPVLSRVYSAWNLRAGDWPAAYEPQVRDAYLANPVAQRAVRMVAEAVGSAPLSVSDDAARALIAAHSAGQALLETVALHLLLHGNAYVQILPDTDGHPRELFALRPERVTVEADARGWPAAYLYRAAQAVTRLSAEDGHGRTAVVHLKAAHPLDDHYGLGCLGAAAGAVAIHNAATRWNKALLDNAARPSGALVYETGDGAVLAPEQFDRLRTELDTSFSGAANAGKPMLLEGGLKWQALGLSPADMDFAAMKAAAARDIALAFGVPPMLLGLPGDATYANYREANRALWRLTVLPLAGLILTGLRQALAPHFDGLTLEVDPDRVPALSEDRERLWAQVAAADFLTLNEKREAVGFEAINVPEPQVAAEPESKAEEAVPIEVKFNPWHDPDDGKFTFSGQGTRSHGGGGSGGGGGASGSWDGPPPKRHDAPPKSPHLPTTVTKPKVIPRGKVLVRSPKPVISAGYRFEPDTLGRAGRVSGSLRLDPGKKRSRQHQRDAGKPDRANSDHGGHFIAREFGGPEIALNHFAQDGRVNKSEYRKLELSWKAELKRGRKVSVDIRPIYSGASRRPDRLEVVYSVDGREYNKSVPNRSRRN